VSQRNSGYARQERDLYETPVWVTRALLPHIPARVQSVWEPAAGGGKMAQVLVWHWHTSATDITSDPPFDFLTCGGFLRVDAIITNPQLQEPTGFVAMLLPIDFDSAKTRRHLFADCPAWSKKIVLPKRIVWFERKGAAPSQNHAWYIWDWQHKGPATLEYAP